MHDFEGKRSSTSDRDDQATAAAPAPGKRTLTEMLPATSFGLLAASVQRKASGAGHDSEQIHASAQRGIATAAEPLPHAEKIQRLFGRHDVSGVQAHVGGDAARASGEIGAQAYAMGNHVAFAQAPDLHTAAHEAAHVVQQRGGVSLSGGIGESGDAHERHADQVAEQVVRGESVEHLLDSYSPRSAGSAATSIQSLQMMKFEDVRPGRYYRVESPLSTGTYYLKSKRSAKLTKGKPEFTFVESEETRGAYAVNMAKNPSFVIHDEDQILAEVDGQTGVAVDSTMVDQRPSRRMIEVIGEEHDVMSGGSQKMEEGSSLGVVESKPTFASPFDKPPSSLGSIGFGTDGVSGASVAQAIELGYRQFDLALMYTTHQEVFAAIKNAIASGKVSRHELVLMFKFLPIASDDIAGGVTQVIMSAIEAMGCKYLDVVMLHRPHPDEHVMRANLKALAALQPFPIIRVGLSNVGAATLSGWSSEGEKQKDMPVIAAVENEFNPLAHDVAVRRLCVEHGIHYVSYSTLGGEARKQEILNHPELVNLAKQANVEVGQLVLAWAISQKAIVIPKASSKEHMTSNLDASKLAENHDLMAAAQKIMLMMAKQAELVFASSGEKHDPRPDSGASTSERIDPEYVIGLKKSAAAIAKMIPTAWGNSESEFQGVLHQLKGKLQKAGVHRGCLADAAQRIPAAKIVCETIDRLLEAKDSCSAGPLLERLQHGLLQIAEL